VKIPPSVSLIHFDFYEPLPIQIEMSDAPLTSDAGLLPLRQFDERIGLTSVEAICFWFGVKATTVWLWRRALGVGAMTEGTTALKSERLAPVLAMAREAALPTLGSPERRAKIAASKRGKSRPPHVIEAIRKGRTGKPHNAKTRLKMGGTHKARGTRPPLAGIPWTKKTNWRAPSKRRKSLRGPGELCRQCIRAGAFWGCLMAARGAELSRSMSSSVNQ
jgi:hypothetical protein